MMSPLRLVLLLVVPLICATSPPLSLTPSPPPSATPSPPPSLTSSSPPSSSTPLPSPPTAPATDACSVCTCLKELLTLNCTNKKLENHFPDKRTWRSLGFAVKEVNFDYNHLVHVLPWARLDSLTKLTMTHNQIAMIDHLSFINLTNIEEIDLSHNHLTSEVLSPHIFQGHYRPDNYEPLTKLRVLRLGFNSLHTLHSDLFEHLPSLEELYLEANPFKVIDRNTHIAITSIPYLKVLDMARTGISCLPDHILHTPKYLEHLNLAGNLFDAPPPQLSDSHCLRTLDLSENPFSVLTSFPLLRNLTKLTISHSPNLTAVNAGALSSLPQLEHLLLHNNKLLSKIDPIALAKPETPPAEGHVWPPIRVLHLHDNNLVYLESMLVSRWDQLTDLRLDGNPWSCDCDNQWLIEDLFLIMEKADPDFGNGLICATPVEMQGKQLRQLQSKHSHMRCLDKYGNRPERDAPLLVGLLVGVLVAVPVTIAACMLLRQAPRILGIMRSRHSHGGAAEYSRAFYKPAETEPDFI